MRYDFGDLALGYIFGDSVDPYFAISLGRMMADTDVFPIGIPSGPKIDTGRNLVVEAFLTTKKDWLLMVDTDMTWSPKMVKRLYDHRDEGAVLSGLCGTAEAHYVPAVRNPDGPGFFYIAEPKDQVIEVAYTGAAFMLAHRSLYEKMRIEHNNEMPWFRFSTDRENAKDMGEDCEFCFRATDMGFRVLVDGSVRPGHRKKTTIGNVCIPDAED